MCGSIRLNIVDVACACVCVNIVYACASDIDGCGDCDCVFNEYHLTMNRMHIYTDISIRYFSSLRYLELDLLFTDS